MDEKLQKVLARAGLGSRRELEVWIAAGRVSVNGRTARLGARVSARDAIRIDGRPVPTAPARAARVRVLGYNKPAGEVCTRHDPEGRPTVLDRLPALRHGRWIAVGRLDIQTTGLLLFTNDGELAHRLMHPSRGIVREYAVRVLGPVGREQLTHLARGVDIGDGIARFRSIEDAGGDGVNHWYHVTLEGGRNREVHRLWESQGVRVSRLQRIRYGPVPLRRGLRRGHHEELTRDQVAALLAAVDLRRESSPVRRSPRRRWRSGGTRRSR